MRDANSETTKQQLAEIDRMLQILADQVEAS